MLSNVRTYIDELNIDGHTIGDNYDDDPILMDKHDLARWLIHD